MTITEATNKLTFELVVQTGHTEDAELYRSYINMAILVGMEHFCRFRDEIIALNQNGDEVGRYRSATDAGNKLGIRRQMIDKCLKGERHSTHKLMFIKQKDWNHV